MQKLLFMINASPYGSERTLSALRLITTLLAQDPAPQIKVFLLSDAVPTALAGQKTAAPPNLGEMLAEIISMGAAVHVCRTCVEARGLEKADWLDGVAIGTMPELAQWTLEADKVVSF